MDFYGYLIVSGIVIMITATLITMYGTGLPLRFLQPSEIKVEPKLTAIEEPIMKTAETSMPTVGSLDISLPATPVVFEKN